MLEEGVEVGGGLEAVGSGAGEGALAAPGDYVHAESAAIIGDHAADPAIAEDAEGAATEAGAEGGLPGALFEGGDLLGEVAHGGEDEGPG